MSCAGLTTGRGAEGARITSRISFGGLSYPDASDALCAETAGEEAAFDEDEFVCAATSTDMDEATSAPTNRRIKVFWNCMSTLRFDFSEKLIRNTSLVARGALASTHGSLPVAAILGCVFEISQLRGKLEAQALTNELFVRGQVRPSQ